MNFKNHVTRLSQYKATLQRMEKEGVEQTHAETISKLIAIPATQIRKDFSLFGIKGNKRAGYVVEELLQELKSILGLEGEIPVVLIGYGNLGKALTRYSGFRQGSLRIVAAFDPAVGRLSTQPDLPVYPPASLVPFILENKIKHAILAVPDKVVQEMFDILYTNGVRGFIDFSSTPLNVPEDAYVNNVDLELELETVVFYTRESEKSEKKDT
ncbi:MAG: redox-sensing transcriptional repressor Rex [Candidatus Neomarinimicrobiota bacterium]